MEKIISTSAILLLVILTAWAIALQLKVKERDHLKEKVAMQQMKLKKDLEECERKANTYELKELVKYLKTTVESI